MLLLYEVYYYGDSGAPVLLFQLLLVPIYIKNKKHYLHTF